MQAKHLTKKEAVRLEPGQVLLVDWAGSPRTPGILLEKFSAAPGEVAAKVLIEDEGVKFVRHVAYTQVIEAQTVLSIDGLSSKTPRADLPRVGQQVEFMVDNFGVLLIYQQAPE